MEQYRAFNNLSSYWMEGNGRDDDIVISSRVRLARNARGELFPDAMSIQQERGFLEHVAKLDMTGEQNGIDDFQFYDLSLIPGEEKLILVEKHQISPALALSEGVGGLLINAAETISVMINEEDHFRIQSIYPGLSLKEAYNKASAAASWLEREIPPAVSERYGYLTACPTNTGTGLRASVMLHLPALVIAGSLDGILKRLGKFGFTARGLYGEGTKARGNLFQLSNEVTLGLTCSEILDKLKEITEEIISMEKDARSKLKMNYGVRLEDMIYRDEAILKNARLLSVEEAFKALSHLKLGCDMGYTDCCSKQDFNRLLFMMQPSVIAKLAGNKLSETEDRVKRADLFREILNKQRSDGND